MSAPAADLAALLRGHHAELAGAVRRLTGCADPRDAIQEACALALDRLARLEPGRLFGWLLRTATLLAGRELRTQRRASRRAADADAAEPGTGLAWTPPDRAHAVLDAALDALPADQRELLLAVAATPPGGIDALAAARGTTVRALRRATAAPLVALAAALGVTAPRVLDMTNRYVARERGAAGEPHGLLTLVAPIPRAARTGAADWTARCACGRVVPVALRSVRAGKTTTCGTTECRSARRRAVRATAA